jgi:hypothetical protein
MTTSGTSEASLLGRGTDGLSSRRVTPQMPQCLLYTPGSGGAHADSGNDGCLVVCQPAGDGPLNDVPKVIPFMPRSVQAPFPVKEDWRASITSRFMNGLKQRRGPVHGTFVCTTPRFRRLTRGTQAWTSVWN